jgi:hypothetical protein
VGIISLIIIKTSSMKWIRVLLKEGMKIEKGAVPKVIGTAPNFLI